MDKVNYSKKQVVPFLGQSDYAKEICKLVDTIANNKSNVLLFGERGTGKLLFAENVHSKCSGNIKNFFILNCRLDDEVFKTKVENLKSELLNPCEDYKSIFFENIDKLNLELQSFVLSFLHEIGKSKNPIKVFCSTESFLENQVQSGMFNKDLYYCISSIILNFLPLRSRKEDIMIIANFYKNYFEKKSGIKFDNFSDVVIEAIENAFWSGNVDELINSVQRAFIVGNKSYISKQDLGLDSLSSSELIEDFNLNVQDKSLKNAIDTFKKEYITKILEENGWNQTKTAKVLGIQRTYVVRLINELNIRVNKV